MELSDSQTKILKRLKVRGPQSIKILSKFMEQTTMGVRQHVADMESKGLVRQTEAKKQNRGRPLNLWKLSKRGHQRFKDGHESVTLDLIVSAKNLKGQEFLEELIYSRNQSIQENYRLKLQKTGTHLGNQITRLAELRSEEGYMAEVRLLPDGWLLTENHCPIHAAAKQCNYFCKAELSCFEAVFHEKADIKRVEHLLDGARRCTFKISPKNSNDMQHG
ncbi:MAG: helix-turn-helix transcriptional regulator [Pseudohongiellaceae bacterium]